MDYVTLKSLSLGQFKDAADAYRSASSMARESKDRVEQQISVKMRKQLGGEAAGAALDQLRQLGRNFHYAQTECGLLATALNGLAHDLRAAQKKLERALDSVDEGFRVREDGAVCYPPSKEKVDGEFPQGGVVSGRAAGKDAGVLDPSGPAHDAATALDRQAEMLGSNSRNPNRAKAQSTANDIAAAVQEATEADEKWASKLRKLKADDDLTVSHEDWKDTKQDMRAVRQGAAAYLDDIKDPPKGSDPAANAQWWQSLSQEEKDAYLTLRPSSIGSMGGLPAAARDEANRTVLADTKTSLELEKSAIPREPKRMIYPPDGPDIGDKILNPDWVRWNAKYGGREEKIDRTLGGMKKIEDRITQAGKNGNPEVYLLGFHPVGKGDGKVILANGNPDTADHTGVYVPGTGAGLENIGGDLNRADKLWRESTTQAEGETVSTITWLDYDTPKQAMPFEKGGGLFPEAQHGDRAEKAGPTLREFLDGNRAAHQAATGDSGHTTAVGHSYGSTVVAEAMKAGTFKDGPLAVDDVVVAGSPGMQAKHAGDLGLDPQHMWAMEAEGDPVPEAGRYLSGLGEYGVNPTDIRFGGNIMETDTNGHSGYWDEKGDEASLSLTNQANVITGNYDEVKREHAAQNDPW